MKNTFMTLALAAAAAIAAPAAAKDEAAPKMTFTHEGVTYIYSETKAGDSTIYKGYARPGTSFYLVASNGHVRGWANDMRVSFDVPDTKVEVVGIQPVVVATR